MMQACYDGGMYAPRKRTTIDFNEYVLERVKKFCAEHETTLSEFVQDAVQQRIFQLESPRPKVELTTYPGGELQPGVDINSNAALHEILDEGVPLDQLR